MAKEKEEETATSKSLPFGLNLSCEFKKDLKL